MPRRESIKSRLGAGTDALFSSVPESEDEVMSNSSDDGGAQSNADFPVSQHDIPEADWETSVPDHLLGGSPVIQRDSVLLQQPAAKTAKQQSASLTQRQNSEQVHQRASKSAKRNAGNPVSQDTSNPAELVKATFYLTPELILKLEEVRLSRLRQGRRVDKSALVREALELLAE